MTGEPNKKKFKHFIMIVLICVVVGMFMIIGAVLFFAQSTDAIALPKLSGDDEDSIPNRTNFVILGVDESNTRTDTVIVGSYNSDTGAIDLISVPRDTYVQMPEERREILRAEGRWIPADGSMKINAVHSYAGKEHGLKFAVAQLEELLGIKIDYSAKVNLEAFKYVVDAIGGVEFDVPQRMYYRDPEQKLYIDLQPGVQVLTGEQAEGLVRYRMADKDNPISRGYVEGDLQRVRVQQDFVKAFISQAMDKQNLLSTTGALITTIFKYVETDFGILDVPKYIGSITNFSPDNISGMTLPGDAAYIRGQSYVLMREPDASEMLQSIFGEGEVSYESSFGKDIMVLNGGNTRGKANEVKNTLEEAGYPVSKIGDYSGSKKENTRILVRKRGQGEDLLEFFHAAEIVIDPQKDCDIKIIVGIED